MSVDIVTVDGMVVDIEQLSRNEEFRHKNQTQKSFVPTFSAKLADRSGDGRKMGNIRKYLYTTPTLYWKRNISASTPAY